MRKVYGVSRRIRREVMAEICWWIVAAVAVFSAIGVVAITRPLFSAFSLVLHLIAIAALYAMLDAHFLAAVQILVYAGAIMVLVVFLIMLLSLKGEDRPVSLKRAFTGGIFLSVFVGLIFSGIQLSFDKPDTGFVGSVSSIGSELFSRYVFTFEIISVLIMVGLVAAVALAKREGGNGAQ
ncbi:MAG: NADH-quinone oxidoreductase subunit J [Candidatus Dadabacteria bacterium]|nr:MAG: NADH-quinone oxidoreductase subunit J [Candidatus Dadabacteria bacterium]